VNFQLFAFIALDLAEQRAAEASRYRLLAAGLEDGPSIRDRVRRFVARGLAAVSRGAAWVVRRLDDCVADELGRALAPTE
jgi:hypothetical protein